MEVGLVAGSRARTLGVPLRFAAAVAVSVLGTACGPDAAGDGSLETWTLAPEVRIGSVDGPDALSAVRDLALGPAGRAFAIQALEGSVRVFEPDGSPTDTLGTRGEGPGEFLLPTRLGFVGDTLWVEDTRLRRVSLFAPNGSHVRDVPRPDPPSLGDGETGRFVGFAEGWSELFTASPGFRSDLAGTRHPFPFMVRRPDGTTDTLAFRDVAHGRMAFLDAGPGGQVRSMEMFSQPFSDVTLWDVAGPEGPLALVDRRPAADAESAAYRVTSVGLEGDTLYTREISYTPRRVDPTVVDSILRAFRRSGHDEEAVREQIFLPDFEPPVDDVVVGEDGSAWIARSATDADSTSWDVVGPSGSLRARVRTSRRLRIYALDGDAVWGVIADELDVPYIVRYRIEDASRSGRAP